LNIEYLLQDYLKFETNEKFDLITMIYCDFCVLNPNQRATLLNKFNNFLNKNGSILIDVGSLVQYETRQERMTVEYSEKDGFWSANPYYVFHNTFKYEKEQMLLDKFKIVEKSKTRENFNWFQCYSIETISAELSQYGFQVVEYFSNVAGDTYEEQSKEIAIVAKKVSNEI